MVSGVLQKDTGTIVFRYDPLDVKAGAFLTIIGIAVLLALFVKRKEFEKFLNGLDVTARSKKPGTAKIYALIETDWRLFFIIPPTYSDNKRSYPYQNQFLAVMSNLTIAVLAPPDLAKDLGKKGTTSDIHLSIT